MTCHIIDFVGYAHAIGYPIAQRIPRTRAHLPPISAWIDVYDPEGDYVGAGIVVAYDPDPTYLVVHVDGAQRTVHWTDCEWAKIGGAAS